MRSNIDEVADSPFFDDSFRDGGGGTGDGGGGTGGDGGGHELPQPQLPTRNVAAARLDYTHVLKILNDRAAKFGKRREVVGFIFGRPTVDLVQKVIIPNIEYWHHRSAEFISFFCIGFSRKSSSFDSEAFTKTLNFFEAKTKWKYSGAVDILVCEAELGSNDPVDFSNVLALDLVKILKSELTLDVNQFMEEILHHFRENRNGTPSTLSNALGRSLVRDGLKSALLAALPEPIRKSADQAFDVATRDVSKQ